jgi:hypothetical protein
LILSPQSSGRYRQTQKQPHRYLPSPKQYSIPSHVLMYT